MSHPRGQPHLFSNRKYRVPRYQRPYAWGNEEVSELWDDLGAVNEDSHFLGSLIFNTGNEDTGYIEIIDGQQRLLTITIFAAVLRDHAKALDAKKADIYHRHDIAIEDSDGTESFRIRPADSITDYFERQIQEPSGNILLSSPSTPEEKRVKEAYVCISGKVTELLEKESGVEKKLTLLDQLRTRLRDTVVISIEISSEEDAYEIFETTNARGLELSVADLLKNLIFKNIKAKGDLDFAKDVWRDISETIESTETDLRKFIRYFWISKYRFVPEKRLFREIKQKMKHGSWDQLLGDLQTSSDLYSKLLIGSERDLLEVPGVRNLKGASPRIYRSIFALHLMGVTQCHVLLLSILRNFPRLGTNPVRIIEFLENFSFQYSAVCKLPTNRIEGLYSKYAIEIENATATVPEKLIGGKIQSIFSKLESDLGKLAPSKQTSSESFDAVAYKNSEASRLLVKYILDRINAKLQKTDENRPDFNTVNIEHLLPRNPDKNSQLKKEDIKGYVNRIGNLTLLSKRINSRLQNATPKEKLSALEDSELAITKNLVALLKKEEGQWGADNVLARQAWMADLAYWQIWKVTK